MKTVYALFACILASAFVPLGAQEKKTEIFNPEKLIGKWHYISGIKNGENVDLDNLKKQEVTFTKDKITLKGDGTFVMKYDLDTTKTPVGIKLEMLESPFGAGAKSVGIIEVKGDETRLCYALMGEEAPKTFDAKEGSKAHLFVLKRDR